jgi:mitochondrial-processing peptidase subunit beta
MLLRGSQGATKGQLAEEIEGMGARITSETDREMSNLNITCMKGDVGRALSMLGDVVNNPTLDQAELEIAKQEQASENDAMNKN